MNNEPMASATPSQMDLVEHWCRARSGSEANGVRRTALDFGVLRRFLSRIVMLEVHEDGRLAVRLCGSLRCRDLGFDPSGKVLSELPADWGSELQWGVDRALETNEPVLGRSNALEDATAKAFLRMPLLDSQGRLRIVLCFDEAVGEADQSMSSDVVHKDIHGSEVQIAA